MLTILLYCRNIVYDSSLGGCLKALHSGCSDVVVKLTAADLVNVFSQSMRRTKSVELKVNDPSIVIELADRSEGDLLSDLKNKFLFSGRIMQCICSNCKKLFSSYMETTVAYLCSCSSRALLPTDRLFSSSYFSTWSRSCWRENDNL